MLVKADYQAWALYELTGSLSFTQKKDNPKRVNHYLP